MTANKAIWQERKETAAQQNDISLITTTYKVGQIKQLDLMIILEGVEFWKYGSSGCNNNVLRVDCGKGMQLKHVCISMLNGEVSLW